MAGLAPDRGIQLQGAANVRDLGGLPVTGGRSVRRGRVIRADSLHRLSEGDVSVLAGLGVHTVLDLRSEDEVARLPATPLPPGGQWVHTPWRPPAKVPTILGGITELAYLPLGQLYESFLEVNLDYLAVALRTMAQPERHAVVFHCYAGKDRTGIVAAILLSILGVSVDDIVADYALTDSHAIRFMELAAIDAETLHFHMADRAKVNPDLLASPPAQMRDFLDRVNARWSSPEELVRAAGLTADELHALRDALTEP